MVAVVTTGGRLESVIVMIDQGSSSGELQCTPSDARISSLSPTSPVTKDACAYCAAVISITVFASCATPSTTKWPLAGSLVESRSWYLVPTSPEVVTTENRLDKGRLVRCGKVGFVL